MGPGRATYQLENIPYAEYDVYVYFEGKEDITNDINVGEYEMTQLSDGSVAYRYGKNSLAPGDGRSAITRPTIPFQVLRSRRRPTRVHL